MRVGDPTVEFEARIEKKLSKSYLVQHIHGDRYFLPFSQFEGYPDLPEADENGYRAFQVSEWWDGVKEPLE